MVPEGNVEGVLTPSERRGLEDVRREVASSLENPIGSQPLKRLIEKDDRVVIVTSDVTRPCPSHILLPPVLSVLKEAGVPRENITILLSTGTHRRQRPEEHASLLGKAVIENYRVVDHDCKDESSLEYVCKTSRGTEVRLNRNYLDADVRIAMANVEMHYFAGYSGGGKAVLPGVAAFETVNQCHSMMTDPRATSGAANGNPVFEDIREGVSKVAPTFIINVVVNENKEVVGVFSGDWIQAHEKAIVLVDSMYKVPIKRKVDVALVSAGGYPKDINLYQAHKAMENAERAVRDGGAIILLAECPEGFGQETFKQWVYEARTPDDVIDRLKKGFVLGGHKAYAVMRVVKRVGVYLKSEMKAEDVKRAMLMPIDSAEDALEEARRRFGDDFRVLVMPYGGSTLPIL